MWCVETEAVVHNVIMYSELLVMVSNGSSYLLTELLLSGATK